MQSYPYLELRFSSWCDKRLVERAHRQSFSMGSSSSKILGGPFFFCTSRHRHMVSRKKEDQHSVQIQSSLVHCAYSSRLQVNISCRSLDQSPLSARMSGRSAWFKRRFLATRNSRSSCPLSSPQSKSIIGDQVLCSTRQNTHSFGCISWEEMAERLRKGFCHYYRNDGLLRRVRTVCDEFGGND